MDFLMKYSITSEEIDKINKVNDKDILKNIVLNQDKVKEIIEYLINLGVKTESIRDLFLYQIGFFFRTKKEIIESFEEYEIDSIVKSLNYDVNTVDMIEFQ